MHKSQVGLNSGLNSYINYMHDLNFPIIISIDPRYDLIKCCKRFVIGFARNGGQVIKSQLSLFITNPESSAVTFTVTPIDINRSVSTSSTTVIIPPSFEVLSVNERNKGIIVEADGNINVYGMSFDTLKLQMPI